MNIKILINNYLEGKSTEDEKRKLYEMLGSFENEKIFKEALLEHLNRFQEDHGKDPAFDAETTYNELLAEIKGREKVITGMEQLQKRRMTRRVIIEVMTAAAVFCIAFILGTVFRDRVKSTIPEDPAASAYTEIKAPFGSNSEITLSDGTEVKLNAGSSLKYPGGYNSQNRDLILDGEAYFKVAKNEKLPLVVNAGNINIRATGTEFNVKAYPEEGIIETTLVNGEVEISQKGNNGRDRVLVLQPNQKAVYALQSDKLTLEKIKEIEPLAVKPPEIITDKLLVSPKTDVEQVTAWTKHKLIIRSENFESLCTKLQRKYDVSFVFRNEEIKKERFSGILLDETFQQVMDVIMLTAPVDYLLDGKTVYLFANKEKEQIRSRIKYKN